MNKPAALQVLLIEDELSIAKNIASYMEQNGHLFDFASNGNHGLELALPHYYDLIILDLNLPGLDGLQVCQQLRQQADRHIPILMLTARDSIEDKVTGFQSGADDYLTKPFSLQELEVRCLALSRCSSSSARSCFESPCQIAIRVVSASRRSGGSSIQRRALAVKPSRCRIVR